MLLKTSSRTHIPSYSLMFHPQFTYMIFIFHVYFTIVGYITNSQLTIYPCGLIVDRALLRYRKVMGLNPVHARIFFQVAF